MAYVRYLFFMAGYFILYWVKGALIKKKKSHLKPFHKTFVLPRKESSFSTSLSPPGKNKKSRLVRFLNLIKPFLRTLPWFEKVSVPSPVDPQKVVRLTTSSEWRSPSYYQHESYSDISHQVNSLPSLDPQFVDWSLNHALVRQLDWKIDQNFLIYIAYYRFLAFFSIPPSLAGLYIAAYRIYHFQSLDPSVIFPFEKVILFDSM